MAGCLRCHPFDAAHLFFARLTLPVDFRDSMPTNPYEPPQEVEEVRDTPRLQARNVLFWRVFACIAAIILVVDACLYPYMIPAREHQPVGAWMLVNLPGEPLALFTARRGYGEPLRHVVKSAGCAMIHWATLSGLLVCAFSSRYRRLSWTEIGIVLFLNIAVPWLLVGFAEWLSPDPPWEPGMP